MWIDELIVKLNSKVKWRVSKKLTALIGLLLLSLMITGAASIYTLYVFNASFQKTLDINIKRTIIAAEMNDDLMRFDRLVVEYIRSPYQADRYKIENELTKINSHFNSAILELKLLKQDSTNNAILSELEPSWNEYGRTVQKILTEARKNNLESAMELWDGWASVRYRDIKYLIKDVIHYNLELAQTSKVKANHSLRYTLCWIIIIVTITSVLSIAIGMIIIRYLQISLRNLILANERVSQGNLTEGLDLAISYNPQDELAELAESNRKVVESIKKMVEDVTALTDRYSLADEAPRAEDAEHKQISDLIDMEKTLLLVKDLTQSLEQIKHEIGQDCKSEVVKLGLEEAHHRTLDTINNFNKEIQKLHIVLESLDSIPERVKQLVNKYGSLGSVPGGFKLNEFSKRLEEIPVAIINTMEVVRFGLLDQIMLLDSRNNLADGADTNHYFVNLAKAIKNIIKQAEEINIESQRLQSSLQQIKYILNDNDLPNNADSLVNIQDNNEYELLLAKLEWIMASFNK
jgi:methyl-accepting chemotaxis protein